MVNKRLIFCGRYSCRTCRKRKTRCDGKRPLCSTCTENGHECLGYADGPEGNNNARKRERREVDTPRKRSNDEDDGEDEDDKDIENTTGDMRERHTPAASRQSYSNPSPEFRRTDLKTQSYFDSNPNAQPLTLSRKNTSDEKRASGSNFVDYRETAVFSDDGPSPMGMPNFGRLLEFCADVWS